jgi:hypothetical protein
MKYSRSLVATLLMSGGLLQLAPLALAGGTAATTQIDNTANATYEDSNLPAGTTTINATSNKVTITVAEVAGLTVVGNGIAANPSTGSSAVIPGNELFYNFKITNTGNGPTTIRVPGTATITTNTGTLNTTGNATGMQYSIDGVSWTNVPVGGFTTGSVAADDFILVRVAVTVTSNTDTTLAVRLGNGANNSTNEDYLASTASDDVYTIPLAGTNPVNLQRESSYILSAPIGSIAATNAAFATVFATRNPTVAGQSGTPSTLNDDVITYKLALKVENSAPATATGIAATDLAGTDVISDVSGSSATAKRILISNAVPAGTTLENTTNTIAGWTKVYTTDATSVKKANEATWTTVYTAGATRVGFVSAVGDIISKGTLVDNLTFAVKVSATGTTYTVNSIAQAFGSTSGGSDLIYDESGDQTPNNYDTTKPLVTATFSTTTGTGGSAVTTYTTGADGVAVATYNVDGSNNNTGTGDGRGEINKYTYTFTASGLLNGPDGAPEAEGLNASNVGDNNLDFTNKSVAVPANLVPGTLASPTAIGGLFPVSFVNTVRNKGTAAANIKLLPEGLAANLPTGTTTVEISHVGSSQLATYSIIGGVVTFVSGSGTNTGGAISATNPVTLDGLAANGDRNYTVKVILPTTAPLSTDSLKGYSVEINAFTGTAGSPTATNKTINRVYNGFIKMTKETKVVKNSGPAVVGTQGTFSADPKTPGLGNIIEYRVTYTNISEAQTGSGTNVILKAKNLVITEDGTSTATGGNKWARDQDNNTVIDTSHVVGSVTPTAGVQFFTGVTGASSLTAEPTAASTSVTTDVTKYVNTVSGTVDPGTTGTFSFQRKLN